MQIGKRDSFGEEEQQTTVADFKKRIVRSPAKCDPNADLKEQLAKELLFNLVKTESKKDAY